MVTAARESVAPVTPGIATPFLRQTKLNGPRPPGVVEKLTGSLEHRVASVSGVAVVFVRTTSTAEFVAAPHRPVTSTEYVAALAALTAPKVKELLGWLKICAPFLRHT